MNTEQKNQPEKYIILAPPDSEEDEIDLLELWQTLWSRKWFIIGLTFACALAATAYALLATPIYKAEVVMAHVSNDDATTGLNALASQYGGLAAMVGIDLGGGGNTETDLATLKSREFTSRFIEDNELMPVLFEKKWDAEKKKWKDCDPDDVPTLWDAYKLFDEDVRKISKDKKTDIITLSISWKDPELAAQWANDLSNRLNAHLRTKAIKEAEKSIDYLKKEINKTSLVNMQEVLYQLIEKQTQTITLAEVREQYAFNIIDPAVVPQEKDKPKRILIVALGTVAGGFFSVFMVFFMQFVRSARRDSKLLPP